VWSSNPGAGITRRGDAHVRGRPMPRSFLRTRRTGLLIPTPRAERSTHERGGRQGASNRPPCGTAVQKRADTPPEARARAWKTADVTSPFAVDLDLQAGLAPSAATRRWARPRRRSSRAIGQALPRSRRSSRRPLLEVEAISVQRRADPRRAPAHHLVAPDRVRPRARIPFDLNGRRVRRHCRPGLAGRSSGSSAPPASRAGRPRRAR
jgi:hypothetical protein